MDLTQKDLDWILNDSRFLKPTAQEFVGMVKEYQLSDKSPDDPVSVMMLGLSGAGKGYAINAFKEFTHYNTQVHITGDVMFSLAQLKYPDRVKNRDDMRRKLTTEEQAQIQFEAVQLIGKRSREPDYVHLIDCHITVATKDSTGAGFLLGLTPENFNLYSPDAILYLSPLALQIQERRANDSTRKRNVQTIEEIVRHDRTNLRVLSMIAKKTRIPVVYADEAKSEAPNLVRLLEDLIESVRPVKLYSISPQNTDTSFNTRPSSSIHVPEFANNISDKVHEIVQASSRTRSFAEQWGKKTKKPVYLVHNIPGAGVFQYAMPHWSSQFSCREDAFEFVDRVKANKHWKAYSQLVKNPFSIRLFFSDGQPLVHDNGSKYILNYPIDFLKSLYDMAILEIATEFLKEHKIDSFVYSISDTLVPQQGDFIYVGQYKSRINLPVNTPGVNILVADISHYDLSDVFHNYDRCLINSPIARILDSNFEESEPDSEFGPLTDWDKLRPNNSDPAQIIFPLNGKKEIIFTINRTKVPLVSELGDYSVIYYDAGVNDANTLWWVNLPEVVYGATDVMCKTNLGYVTLKDFLKVAVAQQTGLYQTNKGLGHEVDTLLRV